MNRRVMLKGALATGVVASAAVAGLITPQTVLAAWPKNAFDAKSNADVLSKLFGGSNASKSGKIAITAPDIAENGAVVPVKVTAKMKDVQAITLLVDKNDQPLAASFNLSKNADGFIATRVKMAKTSDLTAVVKAGGKLYSSKKEVKVTIGGCGG